MITYEMLSEALAKTGALLNCDSIVAFPNISSWSVAIDEDNDFELGFDEELGLIHMSADVAPCPEDVAASLLETLLQYNEQWLATGGVRFGLDATRGEFTLSVTFSASDAAPETLARRLAASANLVNHWRVLFYNRETQQTAPEKTADAVDDFVVRI